MFGRVLVPLDGSPPADAVIPQIRLLLQRKDAELLLVQAVDDRDGAELDRLRGEASRGLDGWGRKLAAEGLRVRTFLRTGAPAEAILDVAEKERASLIALSSHGRGGRSRWNLGGVAEKVLRASAVPVLALRAFAASGAPAEAVGFKKILAGLGGEAALELLDPVIALARPFGAQLLLLNVDEGRGQPAPWIARAVERARQAGVPAEALLRRGDPAHEILEAAREQGVDAIALTTHGQPGASRWMLGGTAERVLRYASSPLLLVRFRSKETARRRWHAALTKGPAGIPT